MDICPDLPLVRSRFYGWLRTGLRLPGYIYIYVYKPGWLRTLRLVTVAHTATFTITRLPDVARVTDLIWLPATLRLPVTTVGYGWTFWLRCPITGCRTSCWLFGARYALPVPTILTLLRFWLLIVTLLRDSR